MTLLTDDLGPSFGEAKENITNAYRIINEPFAVPELILERL